MRAFIRASVYKSRRLQSLPLAGLYKTCDFSGALCLADLLYVSIDVFFSISLSGCARSVGSTFTVVGVIGIVD